MKAARAKRVAPFNGLNAHAYLQDVQLPTYLPRQGAVIETPAHAAPPAVPEVTAMLRIVGAIGRNLSAEENASS